MDTLHSLFITLEIQACDPNPCKHSGICSVSDENIALCTCSSPKYKGPFCETEQIVVTDLPILIRGQVSKPVTITAVPNNDLTINIITDPSINILPTSSLLISPPNSSVSFRIQAETEGIFELEYSVLTTDDLNKPEKQIALVTTSSVSGGGYSSNELLPGCCASTTNLAEQACAFDQSISLSSSCSWSVSTDDHISSGVVFTHIDDIVLPLSIAGVQLPSNSRTVDTVASGTMSCSNCYTNDDMCYAYTPTISDIRDMLHSSALLRGFLFYAARIIPMPVLLKLSNSYSVNPKVRFSSYDFHGIIMQANTIATLYGCENINVQNEALFHVLRVRDDLEFSYFEEKGLYQQNDEETPLCFATSLCDSGNMQVQVGITNAAALELKKLSGFQTYMSNGWKIKLTTISLSRFGLLSPVSGMFWNGNEFFTPSSVGFNIGVHMNIDGNFSGDFVSANFQFDGNVYISADETASTCDVCNCNYCNYTCLFII